MNGKTSRLIRKFVESIYGEELKTPDARELGKYWSTVWKNQNGRDRFQTRKFLVEKISQNT